MELRYLWVVEFRISDNGRLKQGVNINEKSSRVMGFFQHQTLTVFAKLT
jgi:hypothetical protein